MRPAIPQNKPHDYSWSIISNRHLKKGHKEKEINEQKSLQLWEVRNC